MHYYANVSTIKLIWYKTLAGSNTITVGLYIPLGGIFIICVLLMFPQVDCTQAAICRMHTLHRTVDQAPCKLGTVLLHKKSVFDGMMNVIGNYMLCDFGHFSWGWCPC